MSAAGAGAGNGEDGRPAGPACPSGGWAPPGPAPAGAKPGRSGDEEPEYDLAEDLPTMPPASAGAEPVLRWAEVGQLPNPGTGPDRLLYGPLHGPPPGPAGRLPSGAAVANPPAGSVRPRVGERYEPRPLGPPPPARATAIGAGPNAPTLPLPAAQAGPARGRGGTRGSAPDGCHHHARAVLETRTGDLLAGSAGCHRGCVSVGRHRLGWSRGDRPSTFIGDFAGRSALRAADGLEFECGRAGGHGGGPFVCAGRARHPPSRRSCWAT